MGQNWFCALMILYDEICALIWCVILDMLYFMELKCLYAHVHVSGLK